MKRNIAILSNGLARGGTDTFVINLIRGLDKARYSVTIINPCLTPEENVREQEAKDAGATVIHTSPITHAGLRSKLRHLVMLYKILRRGHFDVFQTNVDLFNGPQLLVAWLARVPIRECHSHNTRQARELVSGMTLPVRLYQRLMRWLCWHFSNRRCGCSQEAMDFLFPGHDWHQDQYPSVIYNGIDVASFSAPVNVAAKKRELGLPENAPLVLSVGQIHDQKNPLFAVRVFAELHKILPAAHYVWAGVGPLQRQAQQLASSLGCGGQVHFIGSRSDVPALMRSASVLLFPSNFEGLGIVAIEAQAAGLPVLASKQVPQLAQCGAVQYLDLSERLTIWADALATIIGGNSGLQPRPVLVSKFSTAHMVEQMSQVFG